MELIPIKLTIEENEEFMHNPDCQENIHMTIDFFQETGYYPPWIGYFVKKDNVLVGAAAFKGPPRDNKVEIAYGTFDNFQHRGIGSNICKLLVELSLKTDPNIDIRARTLPENTYSNKVLEKNRFELLGVVMDPEDGEVWEWEYNK